jgi:cation diffusion facilitator CzcD-associated flavoprotein CzcO
MGHSTNATVLNSPHAATSADIDSDVLDALVIGAGVNGVYQLYKLREEGLNVRSVDAGAGPGGTWHFNRYPGSRFDSDSYIYGYFFSKEIYEGWEWSEHYAGYEEIERYVNYVVDKTDLRQLMTFNTRVESATFDQENNRWEVVTNTGETIRARFVVATLGLLSVPLYPPVPGREKFAGEAYHTGEWPDGVDLKNKRVAVVGVGASGVQVVTAIGKADEVAEMTVFQRTANWCSPLRNRPITPEEQAKLKTSMKELHHSSSNSFAGFLSYDLEALPPWQEHTPEQRRAHFEKIWALQGFAKFYANYSEFRTSPELNDEFCGFIADTIRERVKDPETAETLIPKDHRFGEKRPPFEDGYYEVFNKDNVALVDLLKTPMVEITERGIKTTEQEFEFDVIIFATGFDAITGPYNQIDIRAGDTTLKEAWEHGLLTNHGIQTPGFPNLLFGYGPHSPGGNVPRCAEPQIHFVTELLVKALREDKRGR